MRLITNCCSVSLFVICLSLGFTAELYSQSNFDLQPPIQADTNSQQVIMSTDPSALPVFKFATAELKDGNVIVSTTAAKQKLLAAMPGSNTVPAELDPKGVRYTENVTQNYTVQIPYTETRDDGSKVTKMRMETRTRTVPVTRYRKRDAEEQAEYEKAVEAKKREDAKLGKDKKPEIETAEMETVTSTYTVNVPFTEAVDGKQVTRMRQEARTRMLQVVRGKTETTGKTTSSAYGIADVMAYSVDGQKLDEEKLKARITERVPVIVVNSSKAISPYFETILKPETIFLVCPVDR